MRLLFPINIKNISVNSKLNLSDAGNDLSHRTKNFSLDSWSSQIQRLKIDSVFRH